MYSNFSFLDDHWAVQTSLNSTEDGPGLGNWVSPDYIGGGKNGNTLVENMTVLCDGSCSANASLTRPPCPRQVQYVGRGNSVLYQTGNPVPQAWQKTGFVYNVSCIEPEPDPGCVRRRAGPLQPRRLTSLTPLGGKLDPCSGGEGETEPPTNGPNDTTPIVIKLGSGPFLFSSLEDGVEFDIDADGELESVSWTDAAADQGFLVFDFNLNGIIDDGSELFGGMTHQPPSDDPNGFRALALFDLVTEGGDGDGWITPADEVFRFLGLWKDRSHDGLTQPGEVVPLAEAGIRGIELAYVASRRRDRHGNELRWASRVEFENGFRLAAVDVILLLGEVGPSIAPTSPHR